MVTEELSARVLILDGRDFEGERLRQAMVSDGHEATVTRDGGQAVASVLYGEVDLAVIALEKGEYDGLALCRQVRARSDLPMLLLGGQGTVNETVAGLEAGADDYLAPPPDLSEVRARVKALLRRSRRGDHRRTVLSYADLAADTITRRVTRSGRRIRLSTMEFQLMALFLAHPEKVLTREFLQERIWRRPAATLTGSLEVCVHGLRVKLEAEGARRLIRTVRGAGYVLRLE